MSFRWFIYYCSLCGGCAAYVGWVLGRLTDVHQHVFHAAVRGMFLGMMLAVVLTLIDTLWSLSGKELLVVVARLFAGGFVGGGGGFVGGMLGQVLYAATQQAAFLILGWTITGLLIGMSPGIFDLLSRLARNEEGVAARRKVLHGLLGGGLGGLLGGALFLALRRLWTVAFAERADVFWSPSATGFVAVGLCVGLLIGLAQVILTEAWVKVEVGFRAGRDVILAGEETTIGRAETCAIALFGDGGVEKEHARIVQRDGRFFIEDLGTPAGTFVNGERVQKATRLRSGDLIELGRSALRFGERQKRGGDDGV
jgi:hypothetical protein